MTNLYSRLAAYTTHRENYRTEALVDILERLLGKECEESTNRFLNFFSQVLLANSTNQRKKDFLDGLENSLNRLSIKTQHSIPEAIPDIVVLNGQQPVCVVEVKIGAGIGDNQLEKYGEYLKQAEDTNGNLTALVFLTHATSPPEGFTDPACCTYGVDLRSVAYWSTVANWFKKLANEECGIDDSLKTLIYEFSEYLFKEDSMFTLDDIAITRTYYSQSHSSITRAIETIASQFQFGNNWRNLTHSHKPMAISSTRNAQNGQGWINFGLSFKPVDESDDSLFGFRRYDNSGADGAPNFCRVKDGVYAFVRIFGRYETYAEIQKIPGYTNNQWYDLESNEINNLPVNSNGWYYNDSSRNHQYPGYAKIEPIYNLCDIDGNCYNELREWIHRELEIAVSLFSTFEN